MPRFKVTIVLRVCGGKEITHWLSVGLINGSLQLVYDFPRAGTRRPNSDFNHFSLIIIFLNMIFSMLVRTSLPARRGSSAHS